MSTTSASGSFRGNKEVLLAAPLRTPPPCRLPQSPVSIQDSHCSSGNESSSEAEVAGPPGEDLDFSSILCRIQPPGVSKLEAAKILFSDDIIREAVHARPFPVHLGKGDENPIQYRFELALQRPIKRVGDGWLRQRPRSTLDLIEDNEGGGYGLNQNRSQRRRK